MLSYCRRTMHLKAQAVKSRQITQGTHSGNCKMEKHHTFKWWDWSSAECHPWSVCAFSRLFFPDLVLAVTHSTSAEGNVDEDNSSMSASLSHSVVLLFPNRKKLQKKQTKKNSHWGNELYLIISRNLCLFSQSLDSQYGCTRGYGDIFICEVPSLCCSKEMLISACLLG